MTKLVFIKLTKIVFDEEVVETPIIINLANLVYVMPPTHSEGYTIVSMTTITFHVKETVEQIEELLRFGQIQ